MAKRQRLRPDKSYSKDDLKIGQRVFREWCGDNGVCCDPCSAADLCGKIAQALADVRGNGVVSTPTAGGE
jgi:hypothetical protein